MIDKNINRRYFSEKKLPAFFDLCFSIKNTQLFLQNPKIERFIHNDLKFLVQSIQVIENLVDFIKFAVFFKLEADPEIYELLSDQVKRRIGAFQVEELMQVLVNLSHSLSPEAMSVFEVAADDIIFRLD